MRRPRVNPGPNVHHAGRRRLVLVRGDAGRRRAARPSPAAAVPLSSRGAEYTRGHLDTLVRLNATLIAEMDAVLQAAAAPRGEG